MASAFGGEHADRREACRPQMTDVAGVVPLGVPLREHLGEIVGRENAVAERSDLAPHRREDFLPEPARIARLKRARSLAEHNTRGWRRFAYNFSAPPNQSVGSLEFSQSSEF